MEKKKKNLPFSSAMTFFSNNNGTHSFDLAQACNNMHVILITPQTNDDDDNKSHVTYKLYIQSITQITETSAGVEIHFTLKKT